MAFRRIRLQSFAPLPVLRVWFLIPQDIANVKSLKHAIFTHLTPFKDLDTRTAQLILELDDFELLDDCPIELVHEGDILMVKSREPAVSDRLKRKGNVEKYIKTAKRRRLSISSHDSSIVSSSTSDSSSTDSSDSTSDSSSSTDSSDSASPSTELTSNRARKPLVRSNYKDAKSNGGPSVHSHAVSRDGTYSIQQPNVPPGHGKPSTHSRNKRRKLKRKYAAAQSSSQKEKSGGLDMLNGEESPLTGRDSVLQPSMQSSVQPALPAGVSILSYPSVGKSPRGIVSRRAMESGAHKFDASIVTTTSSTLVPPSEREDLPRNLFVTSVEIDWRPSQGRSSRHGTNVKTETLAWEDIHGLQGSDPNISDCIDWTAIEATWDKHKTLDACMELLPDAIVAWKAFGLDPISLTPQASMLHLGRVVSVDMEHVLVQPLTRQNIGCASFGRASVGYEDELADQILIPLKEVWSNGWKLISPNNTEVEI